MKSRLVSSDLTLFLQFFENCWLVNDKIDENHDKCRFPFSVPRRIFSRAAKIETWTHYICQYGPTCDFVFTSNLKKLHLSLKICQVRHLIMHFMKTRDWDQYDKRNFTFCCFSRWVLLTSHCESLVSGSVKICTNFASLIYSMPAYFQVFTGVFTGNYVYCYIYFQEKRIFFSRLGIDRFL